VSKLNRERRIFFLQAKKKQELKKMGYLRACGGDNFANSGDKRELMVIGQAEKFA
jgi:hypothetical protein